MRLDSLGLFVEERALNATPRHVCSTSIISVSFTFLRTGMTWSHLFFQERTKAVWESYFHGKWWGGTHSYTQGFKESWLIMTRTVVVWFVARWFATSSKTSSSVGVWFLPWAFTGIRLEVGSSTIMLKHDLWKKTTSKIFAFLLLQRNNLIQSKISSHEESKERKEQSCDPRLWIFKESGMTGKYKWPKKG